MENIKKLIDQNMDVSFECKAAGQSEGTFVVKTKTDVLPPATPESLEILKRRLGDLSSQFIEFYENWGGISFHEQTDSGAASLCIHPVENWDDLHSEMSEWFDMVDEEDLEDCGIDWLDNCVVFGEVPQSGNYFVVPLSGQNKGKIIYQDHDGLEPEEYASSFSEFLQKFLTSPVEQIDHLGCYTRYSDNKTERQWMPVAIA